MTSLEHVSVGHVLDPLSSWTADKEGEGVVVEIGEEVDVEEVGVGVAVTTSEDEVVEGEVEMGIAVTSDEYESRDGDGVGCSSEPVVPRRSSGRSLRLGSASRARSRSGSGTAGSHSNSNSQSHSRSSVRGGMEMRESSVATSWTPADGSGGRPSGSCEGRPSSEDDFRSGADGTKVEGQVVDAGAGEDGSLKAPKNGTEVLSLSYVRMNASTSTDVRADVSRREEVLVTQEEDIGEEWHPLRYDGKVRTQDEGEGDDENGERNVDVGSLHALEITHGGDQSLEMSDKERWRTFGPSGRNARHLRLEFKQPSPQPWDEIDPPTDNNEVYTSDYYSTLNSKKFETLQNSRRRPLIPHSSYYFGPPPANSAYGTSPVGQIGIHHPREIVRIERDYAGGELIQFSPVFPLELEGRITPTQFLQTINQINEILISAYSIRHAFVDNFLAVFTLQLSTLVKTSHYIKEMRRLKRKVEEMNTQLYNPVGLNILWPQKVAFLFLEMEYY